MTWLIELHVDDVATGPLHGELLDVVTKALEDYRPGYVTKSRVTWQTDTCSFPDCSARSQLEHSPCCSSHGRPLCCEHYGYSHFCVGACSPDRHPSTKDN